MVCHTPLCNDNVSGVGGSADGPVGDPEHAAVSAIGTSRVARETAAVRQFQVMRSPRIESIALARACGSRVP